MSRRTNAILAVFLVDEAVDLAPQREGACGVAKHLFGVAETSAALVSSLLGPEKVARRDISLWCPATARTLAPCEIKRRTMATPRSPVAPVTMMLFPEIAWVYSYSSLKWMSHSDAAGCGDRDHPDRRRSMLPATRSGEGSARRT